MNEDTQSEMTLTGKNVSCNEQEWISMCLKWSNAVVALPLCSVVNGDSH